MHAGDRSETEEEVMEATYAALAEHGYAGLTVQTIADAFPKSKSLLYYHYDDKEAILRDFIDYLVDAFRAAFEFEGADDPRRRSNGCSTACSPARWTTSSATSASP
ncbi:TetR/AcrR family transcriptional regulator [Halosegnis marinus]|uniref:TetR/AcrR family transcriptional regulator n=1 Tax=Halosegnis marinus TaxID=3034023 RepID=UPI00361A1279